MVETLIKLHWPIVQPDAWHALGNADGFSGAQLWRVETSIGPLCLRRWPQAHPSMEHLQWIHSILHRAAERGCCFLPVPLATVAGGTVARDAGHLWELAPWMPGDALLRSDYSDERCEAACRALAQFHVACQSTDTTPSPSPTLRQRLATSERFRDATSALMRAVEQMTAGPLRQRCAEIVSVAAPRNADLPSLLREYIDLPLTMQPCIRDVWYPHILFEGNSVTGMIDFGAMRMDSVALDLARLLSSVDLDENDVWRIGTTAYESIRPLSDNERKVLQFLPACVAVLSGLQWVRWLAVEGRTFGDPTRVLARMQEIVEKLRRLE